MGFIGRCLARAGLTAVGAVLLFVPAAQATFPGQNGKIAFAISGDAFTINPDGSGLTHVAAGAVWPAWSADGRRLAYFGYRPQDPGYGLNVANADGSGQATIRAATFSSTQTSSVEETFAEPAWSPDGGTIAYQAIETACSHPSCIVKPEGIRGIGPGGQRRPPPDPSIWGGRPLDSPDGSQIAWADGYVHLSQSDGTGDVVLGGGFDPSWSPDGSSIAFARYVGCCNTEIHVMNPDGSDERRLTFANGRDSDPAWSPDGTKIAWTAPNGLSVMNADGSEQARLADGGTPDWQPLLGPRRETYKNSSHFCKAEREFLGDEAFAQTYASHGGCVSGSQRK